METIFGFPKADRNETLNFKRNALQTIIFYIGIDENPNVLKYKSEIADLLGKKYGNPKEILQLSVKAGSKIKNEDKYQDQIFGYAFNDKHTKSEFQIQKTQITLTIQGINYKNFNQFLAEYKTQFSDILGILGITELTRVSIRKINALNLVLPSTDTIAVDFLNNALNLELIKSFKAIPQKSLVDSCKSTLTFANGDHFMRLVYGMIQQDISNYNVIIDIDAAELQNINKEVLFEHWEILNNEIYNTFMWSIGAELKKFLTQE